MSRTTIAEFKNAKGEIEFSVRTNENFLSFAIGEIERKIQEELLWLPDDSLKEYSIEIRIEYKRE